MKIVVFDVESRTIPTREQFQRIGEIGHEVGIAVACSYEFSSGEYQVFMQDNMAGLVDLINTADLVATFNGVAFDIPILRSVAAEAGLKLKSDAEIPHYDMLLSSWDGAGVARGYRGGGFKLDGHLKATLGMAKTGNGAMAPVLWQAGKIGELTTYCLADVHRERMLFEHCWKAGELACDHGRHKVNHPQVMLGLDVATTLAEAVAIPPVAAPPAGLVEEQF